MAGLITSLSLSFLIYKMGTIILYIPLGLQELNEQMHVECAGLNVDGQCLCVNC